MNARPLAATVLAGPLLNKALIIMLLISRAVSSFRLDSERLAVVRGAAGSLAVRLFSIQVLKRLIAMVVAALLPIPYVRIPFKTSSRNLSARAFCRDCRL